MNRDELSHQYDPLADTFASVVTDGNWASREAFRKFLPDMKGKKVLDIGCGEGSDAQYYKELGAESVAGIDASKELLEKLKTNIQT